MLLWHPTAKAGGEPLGSQEIPGKAPPHHASVGKRYFHNVPRCLQTERWYLGNLQCFALLFPLKELSFKMLLVQN